MSQLEMDFSDPDEGKRRARSGAQRAADHADRVFSDWTVIAHRFLRDFGIGRNGQDFLCEDVREASSGIVPIPPDERSWGAVFMSASKRGLIRRVGYRPMRSPNCHANPKAVWVWTGLPQ